MTHTGIHDRAHLTSQLPKYRDLPVAEKVGARHAWDVFGPADQLGRINLLSADRTLNASQEVRSGEVFNLCLPLDLPDPPWSPTRGAYTHTIFAPRRNSQDDYLDGFYPQRSTQWDGLRHVRARELGFWGGRGAEAAGPDGTELGIEHWAEHSMVGRGVLVDVARYLRDAGRPLDPRAGTTISVADLQEVLDAQRTTLRIGDVLMIRTGYTDAYLAAGPDERADFATHRDCPGLHAGEEMAEFLWDSGVAAVVADNPAVESVPGSAEAGSLHRRLIPLLGFALGEFFRLGELAEACARDGRYTCLFVGVPLNVPGGVGSPGNSVAIR